MRKPPELVDPDPRWQNIVGNRAALEEAASRWTVSATVPTEIARMLEVSRSLFVHSYFVYEFLVVAVVWSLLAVEAALRDRFGGPRSRALKSLIDDAHACGVFSADEADRLHAARELRDRYVHAETQGLFTVGLAGGMLEASHRAISDLYDRSVEAG